MLSTILIIYLAGFILNEIYSIYEGIYHRCSRLSLGEHIFIETLFNILWPIKNFVGLKCLLFGMLNFFTSCQELKYISDTTFLNSAQANSMEALVKINALVCKDMADKIGACALTITDKDTITFTVDPKPYRYRVRIVCSDNVTGYYKDSLFYKGPDVTWEIEANKDLKFLIKPENFYSELAFSCIGEFYPEDSNSPLFYRFTSKFTMMDSNYTPREQITIEAKDGKRYVVLGQYAKYGRVCEDSVCRQVNEETIVELKNPNAKNIVAQSESSTRRMNYLGL